MSEISTVTAYFLKEDGLVYECLYWVIPRKDKKPAHLKVAGSEKLSESENVDDIRLQLLQLR